MSYRYKTSKILYFSLLGLIIYMPFHYYICELFLKGTSFDNLARDIFILILFILVSIQYGLRLNKIGMIVAFNAVVLVLFALVSAIYYSYPGTFNVLRTYLIPLCMYFICSRIALNEAQLKTIHKLIIVELAIIATYGFFQAFFLGDDFAIMLGYPSQNGYLSSSSYYIGGFFGFQRSVGTFISPNICGVVLGISLCLLITNCVQITKLKRYILIAFTGIGLLATFSRSAIVGMLFAIVFLNIAKLKKVNYSPLKIFFSVLGIVIIIIATILIDKYYLDNLFTDMLYSSFNGMIMRKDLSTRKHIEDLYKPLVTVILHPFGLGFGSNGPMAIETVGALANTVESSIYLMMYEVGIVFGILFFYPVAHVIFRTWKNKQYKYYAPAAICIMVLITFVLLPNVQTYEILFYIFVFIGFYDNKNVRMVYEQT